MRREARILWTSRPPPIATFGIIKHSLLEDPVKRYSSAQRTYRAQLAEHFEFFLTTAGVVLALLVTLSELSRGDQEFALIFLIWLQGFLIWAVHRHSWFRRRALVSKMRAMLQDRVNSHLTVILGVAHFRARDLAEDERRELDIALAAARAVSLELESLSLESLRVWERRYPASVRLSWPGLN
jgi:hypothetical protein